MKIRTLVLGLALLILLMVPPGCAAETTPVSAVPESPAVNTTVTVPGTDLPSRTWGDASDSVVFPPGGFTYAANVHQQGEPDWPPVPQTDVTLNHLFYMANLTYRSYIETHSGETRNIIFLLKLSGIPPLDPIKSTYEPEGLPQDFTAETGQMMYGGIGGRDQTGSRIVMKISIAGEIAPGEYTFQFKVTIDGTDFGRIPCTIKVLK